MKCETKETVCHARAALLMLLLLYNIFVHLCCGTGTCCGVFVNNDFNLKICTETQSSDESEVTFGGGGWCVCVFLFLHSKNPVGERSRALIKRYLFNIM